MKKSEDANDNKKAIDAVFGDHDKFIELVG